ncbi:MAG: tripartite tricarboxylate transporter substrate binding protein [Betaproteobacteria bacterium]|nr:tripartite tricarboxylate transporter substrate binding protein [Betaproteobacteria bacterium]
MRMINFLATRLAIFAGSLLLACASAGSFAQEFPSRPITVIWPYSPGSTTDGFLRLAAAQVSKTLGQSVTIESRSGALGRLGLNALPSAPKDGHLIVAVSTGELVTHGLADAAMRLEPRKDYLPVAGLFNTYLIIIANPSMPFRDLKGLIAYAKTNPGKLNFSSGSTGGPAHLILEFLKMQTGVDIVYVAYRGSVQSSMAVASGEVQLNASDTNTSKSLLDSGRVVGIAAVSPERMKPLPSVPTLAEAGLPGFSSETFIGLIAPAGTPPAAVARLNSAFVAAIRSPAIAERIEGAGYIVAGNSPDQFYNQIKAAEESLGLVVRKMSLKFD